MGHVAGAPVVVSPGWVLAAVALTLLFTPTVRVFAPGIGSQAYVVAAAFVLLLFVSVFLHELAHALVARRRGIVVRELAVTLLGGHTEFGGAARTPGTSALVAVAGPVVNLALGGIAWAVLNVLPGRGLVSLVVGAAAVTNGFVGLFNLLPGLPLDGGRVLEALVWRVTGSRHRGTTAAGWVGRAVAVGVVAWVLVLPFLRGEQPSLGSVLWGALVGAFLWSGAAAAVRSAGRERAVEGLSLVALMRPAVALPADATAASVADPTLDVVLLAPDGRPAAYVDRAALAAVPDADRDRTPLTTTAVPLPVGALVDGGLTGPSAVAAVARVARFAPVMAVLGADGRVVGLLHAQDVIGALRPRS